jgi:3-polyprenyl-4-hydroxybenzoate decarboxylase
MYPYDSLRDYVADLEKRGRCIRIKEIDQDIYESTALVYRMMSRLGDKAPGFLVDKTKNDLKQVLHVLESYREQIKGIVVESTYNWYWLVDGLMDNG